MLIIFEEIGKMQLIALLLFLVGSESVADIDSPSPPLVLFEIPITNLHSIIVEATSFGKALYYELCLSLDTLRNKIKPNVSPR